MYSLKSIILALIIGTLGMPIIVSCFNGYRFLEILWTDSLFKKSSSKEEVNNFILKAGLPSFLTHDWIDVAENKNCLLIVSSVDKSKLESLSNLLTSKAEALGAYEKNLVKRYTNVRELANLIPQGHDDDNDVSPYDLLSQILMKQAYNRVFSNVDFIDNMQVILLSAVNREVQEDTPLFMLKVSENGNQVRIIIAISKKKVNYDG